MRFLDNSLKVVAHNTLLQEWAERVKECRSSGLSVKEWRLENNVGLSTFYTWQKRVFNAVSAQVQQTQVNSSPVFAEIPKELPAKVSSANVAATVRVGEICVDFYENASPAFIESFLRGMKSC